MFPSVTGPASPPGGVPAGSIVVRFRAIDGIRLAGRLFGRGTAGVVLVHQIDGDLYAWFLQSHIDQLADVGFRELDREQTAPEAVAFEDVAVRGRDDDPESRVQQ